MSDENKGLPAIPNLAPIAVVEEPATDLSNDDLAKMNKFIEEGMPGLALIDDPKMYRMMDLYLSGKTYTQIARAMRINRTLLTYLSHKFNWYGLRREFLGELESTIRARVVEAKVISQDFLLQLAHLWQLKIGGKIEQYLVSGDDSIANAIDLKEVDKYLKVVEMLHKLGPDATKQPREKDDRPAVSPVALNLGEGVTITEAPGGGVEVTPKQQTIASMLKTFADFKRASDEKAVDSKKKN